MNDIIFYIEDDRTARDGFFSYFKRKKYEVHAFETSVAAEEALKTIKPQVIISDQKLGNDSIGWEFLQRSIPLSPLSFRFILSGYAESEMIMHSFKEGVVFDYLSKEASNEEIELKIKKACELWHSINGNKTSPAEKEEMHIQLVKQKQTVDFLSEQLTQKDLEIARLTKLLAGK